MWCTVYDKAHILLLLPNSISALLPKHFQLISIIAWRYPFKMLTFKISICRFHWHSGFTWPTFCQLFITGGGGVFFYREWTALPPPLPPPAQTYRQTGSREGGRRGKWEMVSEMEGRRGRRNDGKMQDQAWLRSQKKGLKFSWWRSEVESAMGVDFKWTVCLIKTR